MRATAEAIAVCGLLASGAYLVVNGYDVVGGILLIIGVLAAI